MDAMVYVVLYTLVGGVILWFSAKITCVDLRLREAFFTAGVTSIVSLVPTMGWGLSILVLFILLHKFSDAKIWPDIFLMVIVGRLVSFLLMWTVAGF